jgi:DnaJ-class molecular chaperone
MELLEEDIDVPKGTPSQTVLRKEKAGHQGFKSKNGDLYVKVEV